ncbi:MAG: histidine phosphatase family protein [Verrucomicrobiota bacterium]
MLANRLKCWWLFGLLLSSLMATAQPARIIVIRHAEKPENSEDAHLSEAGRVRARKLVKWLSQGAALGTNGTPTALYAAQPTRNGHSIRCVETLEPLANQLQCHLRTPYLASEYESLAADILRDKSLQGKNIVICWTHDYLPQLAVSLGINKSLKWRSEDFESAYIITFAKGKAALKIKRQELAD